MPQETRIDADHVGTILGAVITSARGIGFRRYGWMPGTGMAMPLALEPNKASV